MDIEKFLNTLTNMKSIIVVEKNSTLKSTKIREYDENELYKKSGSKSPDGFNKRATWKLYIQSKKYIVDMFGKISGRAGQENKYDFPPPADQTLYFGSCVLVCKDENHEICNLTESLWKIMYEKLFGGFEDIGDDDSEEEEEEDDDIPRTKEGYVKDGFIVDDCEDENEDENEDDDEVSYDDEDDKEDKEDKEDKDEIKIKAPTRKIRTRSAKKVVENVFISSKTEDDDIFTCTSELSEDSYD
jgi:hypothetical protein